MEREGQQKERGANPYDSSGFISKVLFLWLGGIFSTGYKRQLEEDDLCECPEANESQRLTDQLEKHWNREKAASRSKPSLVMCFARIHGCRYFWTLAVVFIEEACRTVVPIIISKLVLYFKVRVPVPDSSLMLNVTNNMSTVEMTTPLVIMEPTTAPTFLLDMRPISLRDACLYVVGLFAISTLQLVVHHIYFFEIQHMSLKMKVACVGIMYRKALKLSSKALNVTTSGQIVNLMSNDVGRFDTNLFLCYFIIGPLHMIAVIAILWVNIGWSAVLSVLALMLFVPVQLITSPTFAKIRLVTAKRTDKRVQLMNEIIGAMKIIKLYCWEKPFSVIIKQLRSHEIDALWHYKKASIIAQVPFWVSRHIYVLTIVVVTLYVSDKPLTTSYIFLVLSLSNAMIVSMTHFFGLAILFGSQTLASLRRMEDFLQLDECDIPEDSSIPTINLEPIKNDSYQQVKVENGSSALKPEVMPEAMNGLAKDHSATPLLSPTENGTSTAPLKEVSTVATTDVDMTKICILANHVSACWPGQEMSNQLTDLSFEVKPGELLAIVGPVGAGKSTLLMALLGECPLTSGSGKVQGQLGYVSQEAWIFSSSVRQNITFGSPYEAQKYQKVVELTALDKDIAELPHGDLSLVGERGVSLSGGQKARISLARALYKKADIYLLDDPLSAVDTRVGRHLFDNVIVKELANCAVILVTHQLHFLEKASRILVLKGGKQLAIGTYQELSRSGVDFTELLKKEEEEEDKSISVSRQVSVSQSEPMESSEHSILISQSTTDIRLSEEKSEFEGGLSVEFRSRSNTTNSRSRLKTGQSVGGVRRRNISTQSSLSASNVFEMSQSLGMLPIVDDNEITLKENPEIQEEEARATGNINLSMYYRYMSHGAHWVVLLLLFILFIGCQVAYLMTDWWLANWAGANEVYIGKKSLLQPNSTEMAELEEQFDKDNIFYLSIQVGLICTVFLTAVLRLLAMQKLLLQSSKVLHKRLFQSVVRSPMVFFDKNPVGRILNRFSKDLGIVDELLAFNLMDQFTVGFMTIGAMLLTCVVNPWVFIIVVPTVIGMVLLRRYYVRTSRQIKRLEGTANSPIFSQLSTTLAGLYTVRSYRCQDIFRQEFADHQNLHTSALFFFVSTNRWLGIRLDFMCVLLTVFTALTLIISDLFFEVDPGKAGLSLSYLVILMGMLQYTVRMSAEVENLMTSYERVTEYCKLPSEAALESSPGEKPPSGWPSQGHIVFKDVCLRYSENAPDVLKNLNLEVMPSEKVGIVGRTGAGKSSLLTTLFRITEPRGDILIDGVNISTLGLHDIRSVISIIPQDPVLFTGTVRYNLDPFNKYSDEDIWNSLKQVHLNDYIIKLSDGLLSNVDSGGSNFSVGQRQLLCLARAILGNNKILVVDEATANVDTRTDALIQQTLREQFEACTVLTIAHRLNTVMDSDRILVLEKGEVAEFDTPDALIAAKGLFYELAALTGQKPELLLAANKRK